MPKSFQPRTRQMDERQISRVQRDFSQGMFDDIPASTIPDNGVKYLKNVKNTGFSLAGRTGSKLWGNYQTLTPSVTLPTVASGISGTHYISGASGYVSGISGYTFTSGNVGDYIIFNDGVHERITAFTNSPSIILTTDTLATVARTLTTGKLRHQVNGLYYQKTKRKILAHIGTDVYIARNVSISGWDKCVCESYNNPSNTISMFDEMNEQVILYNSNGIYKFYLGDYPTSPVYYYRINAEVPSSKITPTTLTVGQENANRCRRYVYGLCKIRSNTQNKTRQTASGVLTLDSGTNDVDTDYKDYSEYWTSGTIAPYISGLSGTISGISGVISNASGYIYNGKGFISNASGLITDLSIQNYSQYYHFYIDQASVSTGFTAFSGALSGSGSMASGTTTNGISGYISGISGVVTNNSGTLSGITIQVENVSGYFSGVQGTVDDCSGMFSGSSDVSGYTLEAASDSAYMVDGYVSGVSGFIKNLNITVSGVSGTYSGFSGFPSGITISGLTIPNVSGTSSPERQWDCYSIWGTADAGPSGVDAVTGEGNNPEAFAWIADVPVAKAFSVVTNGTTYVGVISGTTSRYDIGSTLTIATVSGYYQSVIESLSGSSGYVLTSTVDTFSGVPASIGALSGCLFTVNASGMITIVSGDYLASGDVGRRLYVSDGTYYHISGISGSGSGVSGYAVETISGTVRAGCWGEAPRNFYDELSDEDLKPRLAGYPLYQRFYKPIPTIDIGINVPGWMLATNRDTSTIYCSQTPDGFDYLTGYYHPLYQTVLTKDGIRALGNLSEQVAVYCSNSTYSIPLSTQSSVSIPEIGVDIATLSSITVADANIGVLDYGSICSLDSGKQIMITNEPAIRVFDGKRYSANIASQKLMNKLKTLQPATSAVYSSFTGYVFWGNI